MPVSIVDLDPQVSERLRERMRALENPGAGQSEADREMRRLLGGRRSRALAPYGKWMVAALVSPMLLAWGLTAVAPHSPAGILTSWALYAVFAASALVVNRKVSRRLESTLQGEELRALSGVSQLSPAERSYLEAVSFLADGTRILGDTVAGEVLAELNGLLQHGRGLEAQRERIRTACGAHSVAELEEEHAALIRRAEEARDQDTREALLKSAGLCGERLHHARSLGVALGRIEAQEEVIRQTLSSVQAALGRLQAAPAGTPSPAVSDVLRSVTEVHQQTRAVESAVQEVLAVGRG